MKPPDDTLILVVDDDSTFRLLMYERLTSWGYQVSEAEDGTSARQWLSENRPDLILLDVNLPDESGISICKWLKNQPSTQSIPVIQITALPHAATRKEAMMAGVDDFFNKPVDFNMLRQKIDVCMARREDMRSGPELPPGPVD